MEQNSLFRFSTDQALEIVIIFDEYGKIKYANQSARKLLEYGEDIFYINILTIFPSAFQLKGASLLVEESELGELTDLMAYRKNQTCFPVKAKIMEFDNEYICTAYDVSKEVFLEKRVVNVENEAKEAMKVKTEFVANITHELRTPVNGILGNVRELIEKETADDKMKLLKLVERGCVDMNAIINNILDFSKLDAGKFVLEPRKFNFKNMIDYVKGNHKNRIIEKGLEFSISVSSDIPENIIGDELRIVQILNNLISNAYKFTSVGKIHVEVLKTAQTENRIELFVMVRDTGVGISVVDQDKLFKSFSQVDASISRKYGGTGLGLNICKQLVELMGGNIHVDSTPGKGSVFSFDIWVEVPEEEINNAENIDKQKNVDKELFAKLENLTENLEKDDVWEYGEKANRIEMEKKMSKLILCIEMENWEKAELFADTIKQLVAKAPRDIQSATLRLKMSVQRGDYQKSMNAFEHLQQIIWENLDGEDYD